MDELKKELNSAEDVSSGEPKVTEADVVAAFNDAEQTLSAAEQAVQPKAEQLAESVPSDDAQADTKEVDHDNDDVAIKRSNRIQQFQMELNLDDIPDVEGMRVESIVDDNSAEYAESPDEVANVEAAETVEEELDPTTKKAYGCLIRILFCSLILVVSCALTAVISTFLLDVTGSTGNSEIIEVVIPSGSNTEQISEILKDKGLINNTWYFRVYARITGADGKWQVGAFSLQSDMGFPALIETMQVAPPRETVKVLLREGLTVDEMAAILEEEGVCTKQSFLDAVMYGNYDYDFIRQIPTEDDNAEMAHRVYRLEGYLFPDTYEFYVGSQGETVVNRMLQNLDNKLTDDILSQIEERGWTIDQAITFASMVQGEGDTRENMDKVSRVLHNRLDPKNGFKKLELCSTRDYANAMAKNDRADFNDLHQAYNTYNREGFPIGPICNPGMDALEAVLAPSEDAMIVKCYYFATDYKTGITYFSKTYAEHQAIIKKYGIEDIG